MDTITLITCAIGLSMDAFAVAICKGLNMRKLDYKQTALIALFFGGFQAGMPLIGWLIGSRFSQYVQSIRISLGTFASKRRICSNILLLMNREYTQGS